MMIIVVIIIVAVKINNASNNNNKMIMRGERSRRARSHDRGAEGSDIGSARGSDKKTMLRT